MGRPTTKALSVTLALLLAGSGGFGIGCGGDSASGDEAADSGIAAPVDADAGAVVPDASTDASIGDEEDAGPLVDEDASSDAGDDDADGGAVSADAGDEGDAGGEADGGALDGGVEVGSDGGGSEEDAGYPVSEGECPDGGDGTVDPDTVRQACGQKECGTAKAVDTCGRVQDVECGLCEAPLRCGDDGACGCTPSTCAAEGASCGEIYDGCGGFVSCGGPCASGETVRVRLVSGNISSGKYQDYDEGHGIRILQGLKPDVAFVQEYRYGDYGVDDQRRLTDKAFGEGFYFVAEEVVVGGLIPNAVVSRYPILDWGLIYDGHVGETRQHVWARIDLPGDRDLWAFSVHLPTNGQKRYKSGDDLMDDIGAMDIPEGDFIAIGGDFNTNQRDEAVLTLMGKSGLVVIDTEDTAQGKGDGPVDQEGKSGTNVKRTKPYDAIYTSQNLKDVQTQVVIGKAQGLSARGLVFDSRSFEPLSEVWPVRYSDSEAEGMQHMAVVKDFALPR